MTYQFDPFLGTGRDGAVLPAEVRAALSSDATASRAALGLGTAAATNAAAYATAAQGAKAEAALPATADAIANVLEAAATGAPADLARIKASVSGYFGQLVPQAVYAAFIGNSLIRENSIAEAVNKAAPQVQAIAFVGVNGNTTAMIDARVNADVPDMCNAAFCMEVANDASTGVTKATHIANWRSIWDKLRARLMEPVQILGGPITGANKAQTQLFRTVQILLAQRHRVACYDPYRVGIDPITGDWTAGFTADGTHPTSPNAEIAGATLGQSIKDGAVASLAPTYNNVAHSLFPANNLLLTDSDANGRADNIAAPVGAGADLTLSIVSGASDGIRGNWQKYACLNSPAGATKQFTLSPSVFSTGLTTGDWITVCWAMKAENVSNANIFGYVRTYVNGGGGDYRYAVYERKSSFGMRRLQVTFQVTGAINGMQLFLTTTNAAAGTYTCDIFLGEVAIYNVTALLGR